MNSLKCFKKFILVILLLGFPHIIYAEERPKVALVLGGGGAKGFAHIAVLELIEEMGIPIDMVIGSSAGAIVGGLYSAGYTPEMMKNLMIDMDWVSIFQDKPVSPFEDELGTENLPLRFRLKNGISPDFGGGYSTGESVYTFFKSHTVKIPSYTNFDELRIPFRAAVVEPSKSNKLQLIGEGDLAEAKRSSLGLPGVFEPFIIDGKRYIDGGARNNLPIRAAREMGYDIIIAIELFPDIENFDTSPLTVPEQLLGLFFYYESENQYTFADAILTPNLREFSMFNFLKARKIFSILEKERENFRGILEMIREKIYSTSTQDKPLPHAVERPLRLYAELPSIVPERLVISGALPSDMNYINRTFSRLIAGKPLDADNASVFINTIYATGHYRFVTIRTDIRAGEPCLELILHAEETAKTLLLIGGTYQGTLSAVSSSTLTIGTAIQFRGLSGPGSVLSVGASFLKDFSLNLLYLQPLTQKLFISAGTGFSMDLQDVQEPLILDARGKIRMGIQFNDANTLSFGPAVMYIGEDAALCFIADYRFSSLDYQTFPSRGFYAGLENILSYPLQPGGPMEAALIADRVSAEISAAIPLNSRFSIIANLFAGYGLHPFVGFSALDRMYFPHLSVEQPLGAHKAASSLILQFQPWKNLTIFGGQVIFSVSGAAGQIVSEWQQVSWGDLIWNASVNAGLRLGKNFGIQCKAGAGKDSSSSVAPFFSIDIGSFRY
ncbi:hypothetical protein AGMMS4952_01500 [Spirochaetia bacterium]|nr:hypothetical protein AGMMS4952_01500 [Spirochaetia bacterium]